MRAEAAGREKNCRGEAAPSLGTAEQGLTVAQHKPPIDRTSKARSQQARQRDRRRVRSADEDKALKDR